LWFLYIRLVNRVWWYVSPSSLVHNPRKGREGKEIAQCYLYVTIHNQVVPEAYVSCVLLYLFTLRNLLPFTFRSCLFPSVGCAPGLRLLRFDALQMKTRDSYRYDERSFIKIEVFKNFYTHTLFHQYSRAILMH
jgi:hypothetical protein